jgi:hypothetical protein
MNSRSQMVGGLNRLLPKEINENRFFWDSHWLEIWSNHFCPPMGPNGGSVAMDSEVLCKLCLITITKSRKNRVLDRIPSCPAQLCRKDWAHMHYIFHDGSCKRRPVSPTLSEAVHQQGCNNYRCLNIKFTKRQTTSIL